MEKVDLEEYIGGTWICKETSEKWQFHRNENNNEWNLLIIDEFKPSEKRCQYKVVETNNLNNNFIEIEKGNNHEILISSQNSFSLKFPYPNESVINLFRPDR